MRRKERIFSLMAKAIKSRNAVQCRSHHQKMVQTYGEHEDIIFHYENRVIPHYEAKIKEMKAPQKVVEEPIPFCVVTQTKNHFRIELNASMILNY